MILIRVGNGTRVLNPEHIVTFEIFENSKTVFAKGTAENKNGVKKVNVESITVKEPFSIKIKTTNGVEYINCKSKEEVVNEYVKIMCVIDPSIDMDCAIEEVNKLYVKKQ